MGKGLLIALGSGMALGSVTSLASLSYLEGGTVTHLLVLRGLLATLAVAIYCRMIGQTLKPCPAELGYGLLIGLALTVVGLGYMGSVYFISPGLAVALMFIYPVLVLIIESIIARNVPHPLTMAAFALALFGITLSIGIDLASLDWRGIALALAGALAMASMMSLISSANRRGFGFSMLLPAQGVTMLAGVVLVLVVSSRSSIPIWPESLARNSLMMVASSLYALGILLSFVALRFAPAQNVALMMNIEPITTLVAARLLVAENLSVVQYGGIFLAVSGIALGGFLRSGR